MTIMVAVLKETRAGECRVALVPSLVDRMTALGVRVAMQSRAGVAAGFPDSAYRGVEHVDEAEQLVAEADVVLAVQQPPVTVIQAMRPGGVLICFAHGQAIEPFVAALQTRQILCFAMERVPRISRAQAMDALSSQAVLSGYYAALLGATHLARILPRMTTAVGTLRAATVLVMGLGVAGLQALATARRLGAIVEGCDVRPETREEAASVGAKFVETGVDARGEGGYARELTDAEKQQAAAILTTHIQQADIVITTAAVPGRQAPRLISAEQVAGMKRGAVIIDLAAESGGNCALTRPGETVRHGPVTILGPANLPSMLAEPASELYAKNLLALLETILRDGQLAPDWTDTVIAKTALTGAPQDRDIVPPEPRT